MNMNILQSNLSRLICGEFNRHTELKDVFQYQSYIITKMENAIVPMLMNMEEEENISLLGSFYGRKLLEAFCNTMIGRIDPVRLISIKNVQKKNFSADKRMPIAVQWAGDVFEKYGDKVPSDLWHNELSSDKVGRPLFGIYFFEIFWKPAFVKALDYRDLGTHFFVDYGDDFTIDKLAPRLRQDVTKLYSTLSKGVHSELIINLENTLDANTIKDTLKDLMKFISTVGLLSHFIDTSSCTVLLEEAYETYLGIKETYK
ncbi:MAG: hypothetical protein E7E23_11380 [Paenibacillus sp.]|uniref:hypothetical protein n=1 Tax=Paenibacillus TaxID=44249 RepID=UPI000839B4E3|nr:MULTISPECIES: hypothetical protein [Paenibacillus]MDU2241177.1 hypothetical protein [Paenibacillus sp.]